MSSRVGKGWTRLCPAFVALLQQVHATDLLVRARANKTFLGKIGAAHKVHAVIGIGEGHVEGELLQKPSLHLRLLLRCHEACAPVVNEFHLSGVCFSQLFLPLHWFPVDQHFSVSPVLAQTPLHMSGKQYWQSCLRSILIHNCPICPDPTNPPTAYVMSLRPKWSLQRNCFKNSVLWCDGITPPRSLAMPQWRYNPVASIILTAALWSISGKWSSPK